MERVRGGGGKDIFFPHNLSERNFLSPFFGMHLSNETNSFFFSSKTKTEN